MRKTIDASKLPNIFLEWDTKDTHRILNCKTNKIKDHKYTSYNSLQEIHKNEYCSYDKAKKNNNNVYINKGNQIYYSYFYYHAKEKLLELSVVTMDSKINSQHEWKYAGNRFFIDIDKNFYTLENNKLLCIFNKSKYNYSYKIYNYYYAYNGKDVFNNVLRANQYKNLWKTEFIKFYGSDTYMVGNGAIKSLDYVRGMKDWYITKQKSKGKGKEQKIIDKLIQLPLSEINTNKYPPIFGDENHTIWNSLVDFLYYEKINDQWEVIRYFARNKNYTSCEEIYRYYISKNKFRPVSKNPILNNWIPSQLKQEYGKNAYWANKEEMFNSSTFLHLKPVYASMHEHDVDNIIALNSSHHVRLLNYIAYPEIEQLYNLGYTRLAQLFASDSCIKSCFKNRFGDYNPSGKNLLNKIGMTKNQLDYYLTKCNATDNNNDGQNYIYFDSDIVYGLSLMKSLIKNTKSLTINDFKNTLDMCIEFKLQALYYYSRTNIQNDLDYMKNHFKQDDILKLITRLNKLYKKHPNAYQLYKDTVNLYYNLGNQRPNVSLEIKSYSDLTILHDSLNELYNAQRSERERLRNMKEKERIEKVEKTRIKIDKERKDNEYFDSNFTIRLPINGQEITEEGIVQHICIGSYVESHSLGHTNLYFLRKNSEPNEPFYAIEVDSHNRVVQIHGRFNKWLGNNPEVIPTVMRFLKKNNFSCTKEILTCQATGYSNYGSSYCELPSIEENNIKEKVSA